MGLGKDIIEKMKSVNSSLNLSVPGTFPFGNPKSANLTLGGSADMGIDGSLVAPKEFAVRPNPGEVFVVYHIPLVLVHAASAMSPDKFGGITALPNGLELCMKQGGVQKSICTLKNNLDIASCFFGGQLGTGNPATAGFFDTPDFIVGRHVFPYPVFLEADKGDSICFKVQDALSGVPFLQSSISYTQIAE
jgi:hypothetical protein